MSTAPTDGTRIERAPGFDAIASFGDPAAEYRSLLHGAALLDRSARLRMIFHGAKVPETLTGLVTNDVAALQPGDGQFAAALTAKGKIVADVRIFARTDDWLVDASAPAAQGFRAMITKYVNPRLARYADVTGSLRDIGLFGPRSAEIAAKVLGVSPAALENLAPYHHAECSRGGSRVTAAAAADLGIRGYDVMVDEAHAAALWRELIAAGATPAGGDVAAVARIEAGFPLWGTDMDDNTLAQEANLDALGAISYTKGCYTGQETVARIHFRGHVNRSLRGLTSETVLPKGALLFDSTDDPCGDVRSSALSPRVGPIAIAMLKQAVTTQSTLSARWDGGSTSCIVRSLPFTT